LVNGAVYEKLPAPPIPAGFEFFFMMMNGGEKTNTYRITLPPHSYKVFGAN
jgi:hypothetical protein